ncbi:MAG: nucleotide sugar dehydrogenase [Hyphomicrobiales bacterium]|nr:nucleotide sugar dehydrogenase [Hyphomicrobiales bacterium]
MTQVAISVIGLGKVGVTLVAALTAAGYSVTGVDVIETLVKALNDGSFRTNEPGVMERLARLKPGQFLATMDPAEAVHRSSVSFIIVPTPSNTLGGFSNRLIIDALKAIGKAAAQKSGSHVVSVVSTVLPKSSSAQLIPALEESTGRRIGDRLGYCYNPSFIAQGEVMKGLISPEYVLIGESDPESGATLEAIHRRILTNEAPAVRVTPIEAEITKLASNTHETMRVAFANMLLALCNEVPDADVDRITHALAYRLGRRFFKGAVPYGGPCWPRDNRALAAFMDLVGVPSTLPDAIDQANFDHGRYVLRQVLDAAPRGASIGVIGLAYKPGTSMIDRSFGIDLADWLAAEGRFVVGWDPMANEEARQAMNGRIRIVEKPEECLKCDAAVIALPLQQLAGMDWSQAGSTVVIDCWRALDEAQRRAVGRYVPLGIQRDMKSRVITTPGYRERFDHLTN